MKACAYILNIYIWKFSYVTLSKVRIFLYSSNLSSKMGKLTVPAKLSGLGIQGLEHGTG